MNKADSVKENGGWSSTVLQFQGNWAVDVEHRGTSIFTQTLTWEQFSVQRKAKNATNLLYSPAFPFQPKQPLSRDKSSNTLVSPAWMSTECAIHSLEKKKLLLSGGAQSMPDHPRKFTASSLSTKQKCWAEWKGSADAVTEAFWRLLVEPQIAWLVLAAQPYHGQSRTIDFQPRWWSLAAATAHFFPPAFLQNERRLHLTSQQVAFWPAANHNSLSTTNNGPRLSAEETLTDMVSEAVWALQRSQQLALISAFLGEEVKTKACLLPTLSERICSLNPSFPETSCFSPVICESPQALTLSSMLLPELSPGAWLPARKTQQSLKWWWPATYQSCPVNQPHNSKLSLPHKKKVKSELEIHSWNCRSDWFLLACKFMFPCSSCLLWAFGEARLVCYICSIIACVSCLSIIMQQQDVWRSTWRWKSCTI